MRPPTLHCHALPRQGHAGPCRVARGARCAAGRARRRPSLVELKLRVRALHVLLVPFLKVLGQDDIPVAPHRLQARLLANGRNLGGGHLLWAVDKVLPCKRTQGSVSAGRRATAQRRAVRCAPPGPPRRSGSCAPCTPGTPCASAGGPARGTRSASQPRDGQKRAAAAAVRWRAHLAIQAARAQQRRVQRVGAVGGHDHLPPPCVVSAAQGCAGPRSAP